MSVRRLVAVLVVVATTAVGPAPALASVGEEVASGHALAGRLHSGAATCRDLSDDGFEHLGEYVMDRLVGSRTAHQAMNAHMEDVMGGSYADRMHEALGRDYAGCDGGAAMGPGMTGDAHSGWGAMMGSANWSWMHDGGWRHMSRADWRHVGSRVVGPGMMDGTDGGVSAGAVVAIVLGAMALGGLTALLVVRRPWRRRSPPTTA
jgi:hypothetical protein